jgi:hypothetical protein
VYNGLQVMPCVSVSGERARERERDRAREQESARESARARERERARESERGGGGGRETERITPHDHRGNLGNK